MKKLLLLSALLCSVFAGLLAQTINGRVIYDPNNNQTYDGNDFAMPAIKMYLYEDNNNNGVIDANEKIDSTITDAYGRYSFSKTGTLRYTFSIGTNSDDANQRLDNGSVDISDSKIFLGRDGANCSMAGLRFTAFNAPIDSIAFARIRFMASDDDNGTGTTLNIFGQSAQNASTFTTTAYDLSSRSLTSQSTQWALEQNTKDNFFYTANVAGVIREIMTTNSWATNNPLVFLISDPNCVASTTPFVRARSRNKTSTNQPRLEIFTPTGKRYFVAIAAGELGTTAQPNVNSITIAPGTTSANADFYVRGKAPICYAVGDNGNSSYDDDLVAYNRLTGTSTVVKKNISTNKNIEAMALNLNGTRIVAMDGDVLAKYDFESGAEIYRSSAISNISYRNASRTSTLTRDVSDPDAMTMDAQGYYWLGENASSSINILLKVDSFGNVIRNTFGSGIDGLEIILSTTLTNAGSTKLDDLAFNPVTGKMYGSFTGGSTEYIAEIPLTGSQAGTTINLVTFSTPSNTLWTDLEGLGMTNDGVLTGTTGANSTVSSQRDNGLIFNQSTLKLESATPISASSDFESCNCFTRNTKPLSALTLSGKVFDDANGLTDNIINGTGINNPSSAQLYAYLLDAAGNIVSKATLASDGSYSLQRMQEINYYKVVISTLAFNVSDVFAGGAQLPSNWEITGDSYGTNNSAGSGNESGTPDLEVLAITTDANVTNVNFGINKRPETDPYSFSIASPALNSVKSLTANNGMDSLSGSDFEDGIKGVGSTFIITDTTGLNGNTLFYDANNNGIVDAGERIANNRTIANYNAGLLKAKFTGLNTTRLSFTYSSVDAGGLTDLTPATYQLTWVTPVPVVLIYFNAEKAGENASLLTWATASEINNSHFEVLRSTDAITWEKIGEVAGHGTTQQKQLYSFIDNKPQQTNFYRLKQIDFDGKFELTVIRQVNFDHSAVKVFTYPNPAQNELNVNISFNQPQGIATLTITDLHGREVLTNSLNFENGSTLASLDVSMLGNGMYILTVQHNEELFSMKFIKK